MAYNLKTTNYTPMEYTHSAALDKGEAIYFNGQYVFPVTATEANKAATYVLEADVVEVDCDNTLTYTSGQAVYDNDTTATGSVNKTSGAGRKKIGVVSHPEGKTYAVGTTKIQIRFIPNEV
jgi:hypothetical protein